MRCQKGLVALLSRELLKRGHRMVIFTVDRSVRDEVIVMGERLKICVGPDRPKHARDFFSEERKYLVRAIHREKPDVLHAQWTYEFALAAIASGLPYIVTAHDAPINVLRRNFIPYRIARTLMAYLALWRAKRVVGVSPYVARHLRQFGFHWRPIQVIPNGLSQELFDRRVLNRTESRVITFATVLNGWAGYKNGQVAIQAFAQLHKQISDARLLMFGHAHGAGEIADMWSRERGLERDIEFVGQVPHDQLIERLRLDVDVLVHPSLEESHGMALIEAMALGIPVIGGSKSGAVPWTLDEGRAGILVNVNSPRALFEAMSKLAGSAQERKTWGAYGSASVQKRFHVSSIADEYEDCYQQALHGV
jgi:L-malate glycosyltransferase